MTSQSDDVINILANRNEKAHVYTMRNVVSTNIEDTHKRHIDVIVIHNLSGLSHDDVRVYKQAVQHLHSMCKCIFLVIILPAFSRHSEALEPSFKKHIIGFWIYLAGNTF